MSPVRIRENGVIKEYNPRNKDCIDALQRASQSLKYPTFHIGDLSEELINTQYTKADTLAFAIGQNSFDSPGTGCFTATNLSDEFEWRNERKDDPEKLGKKMNLYCIDLDT